LYLARIQRVRRSGNATAPWKTGIEFASAIFDYLETFHNRQRRRSSLGMLTPIEYERVHPLITSVA
jgi:putative transposase